MSATIVVALSDSSNLDRVKLQVLVATSHHITDQMGFSHTSIFFKCSG